MLSSRFNMEGHFLIAMPNMGDSRFENTIIFICAHSDEGAMGFIINQSLDQPKTDEFLLKLGIVTDADIPSIPPKVVGSQLAKGGPVEPGRGFLLHSSEYSSKSTLTVNDEVCLTATLDILRDLATGKGPKEFFLALGYSGWGAGQLEDEIAANGWLTCTHSADIIYDLDNAPKYLKIMKSMGIDPFLISHETGHA